MWPWWHVGSGRCVDHSNNRNKIPQRKCHKYPCALPLPFPIPSFCFFSPDFKRAPGWDKLMFLRCGNQILNMLPSPSSLFFSCFPLKPPSFPHPIPPAVLCNRVYCCSGKQCDRSTERNWKDLVHAFFFSFFFRSAYCVKYLFFLSFFLLCPGLCNW